MGVSGLLLDNINVFMVTLYFLLKMLIACAVWSIEDKDEDQ